MSTVAKWLTEFDVRSSLVAAVLAFVATSASMDTRDRYYGTDAARDLAALKLEIEELELELRAEHREHARLPWHAGAGEAISALRARLTAERWRSMDPAE